MRNGVSPSCVVLPGPSGQPMLQALAQRLPSVPIGTWAARLAAGDVLDVQGQAVHPQHTTHAGMRLYYYRSLPAEPALPFAPTVLYRDTHLLVADKPHFMPVVPSGRYLHNTLLVQLKQQLGLPDISPLHRIDRDTAGLVLLSVQASTRGAYQALFRKQSITKHYEAVAPWQPQRSYPFDYSSRIEESAQFFRCCEVPGPPNAHTRIDVLDVRGNHALYSLSPISGKRHQLRVHMSALGMPICNDPYYPEVNDPPEGDYSRPLQLLARSLAFTDPLSGEPRRFTSTLALQWPPA